MSPLTHGLNYRLYRSACDSQTSSLGDEKFFAVPQIEKFGGRDGEGLTILELTY